MDPRTRTPTLRCRSSLWPSFLVKRPSGTIPARQLVRPQFVFRFLTSLLSKPRFLPSRVAVASDSNSSQVRIGTTLQASALKESLILVYVHLSYSFDHSYDPSAIADPILSISPAVLQLLLFQPCPFHPGCTLLPFPMRRAPFMTKTRLISSTLRTIIGSHISTMSNPSHTIPSSSTFFLPILQHHSLILLNPPSFFRSLRTRTSHLYNQYIIHNLPCPPVLLSIRCHNLSSTTLPFRQILVPIHTS